MTRKSAGRGIPVSPQPLLLLLPQLHVPLDHFQDMFCLVICQARQVQLPAHGSWPRHAELLVQEVRTRRGKSTTAPVAEAGTTLGEDRGMEKQIYSFWTEEHLKKHFCAPSIHSLEEYLSDMLIKSFENHASHHAKKISSICLTVIKFIFHRGNLVTIVRTTEAKKGWKDAGELRWRAGPCK